MTVRIHGPRHTRLGPDPIPGLGIGPKASYGTEYAPGSGTPVGVGETGNILLEGTLVASDGPELFSYPSNDVATPLESGVYDISGWANSNDTDGGAFDPGYATLILEMNENNGGRTRYRIATFPTSVAGAGIGLNSGASFAAKAYLTAGVDSIAFRIVWNDSATATGRDFGLSWEAIKLDDLPT